MCLNKNYETDILMRIIDYLYSPGDLPNPGIKPESPALQADSLPTEL